MGMRLALIATQDHAFVYLLLILSQTKHTVDAVDLSTQAETPQRQVLDTSPDISDRCQDSWLSRRNVPWNTVGLQHCGSQRD